MQAFPWNLIIACDDVMQDSEWEVKNKKTLFLFCFELRIKSISAMSSIIYMEIWLQKVYNICLTTLQLFCAETICSPHCFTVLVLLKPKRNSEGAGHIDLCFPLFKLDCTAIKNMTLLVNFRYRYLE